MILKKQLKKLKKSKTLENLHLESLKPVEISEKEIPKKMESDAKMEILKNKIFPLLPEYLRDVTDMCFKRSETKNLAVETDRLLMSDDSTQTEHSTTDGETQTKQIHTTEKNYQTDEKQVREEEIQTEQPDGRDSFTQIETGLLAKSETERDAPCQTDFIAIGHRETQTDAVGNEKEIQTEEIPNVKDDPFPEKKLENLTKSLEEHATLLKECADFSEELRKGFSISEEVLTVDSPSLRDQTVQTDTFRFPKWNQIPFPCGLSSLIPTRNLFSPMATLLTPLGRIFG